MDYEKKIKNALNDKSVPFEVQAWLEEQFPELKESEDEKIRKDIISYLKSSTATSPKTWIAWLEKQGEQKSDKVEPKFKVGDWCIDNEDGTIFQIVKVLDNTYTYKTNEGKEYSCTHYSLENDARLWTIQDAKDGDVLVAHECYVIFKEIDGLNIKCYCTYYYMGFNPSFYVDTLQNKEAFHPATKEQRDTLMKAMADAGYIFDFEKKELRKLKFRVGDIVKSKSQPMLDARKIISIGKDCYLCEDRGCIGFAWEDDCELVEPQPKHEWSEEDRKIIIELIGIFESAVDGGHVTFPYRLLKDYIRVLKSCI